MSNDESEAPPVNFYSDVSVVSAGAMLREARLSAGVHIESIAFSLKVPVSKIEALEKNEFDALPDAVFARALTSSVCRLLKIDPAPVLELVPQTAVKLLLADDAAVNSVFRDGSELSRSRNALARVSRPLGLAVIVLLVGAGALAWMPSSWLRLDFANALIAKKTALDIPTAPIAINKTVKPPEDAAIVLKAPAVVTPIDPTSSVPALMNAVPDGQAPEKLAATNTPRLMIAAKGETWVQVKDSQGLVILERILRSGENASVNQTGRLSVVVGRADATEVRVAGEKLDITTSTRENVARFEVKP